MNNDEVCQPSAKELESAYDFIGSWLDPTPVLESKPLNDLIGCRVLLKAEGLQRTGSFKYRGALWRLSQLESHQRKRGVVTFSSGNFALGLAAAGRELDIPVTVVMPDDAPISKIDAVKESGASICLTSHGRQSREAVASARANEIATEQDLLLVHPFDDPHVVAGQASMMLELLDQLEGVVIDYVLVPVGGGGLIAGAGNALSYRGVDTRLIGVEPVGYDSMGQSLIENERLTIKTRGSTLCDALMAPCPGAVTYEAARRFVDTVLVVDDGLVRQAMLRAFEYFRVVQEPSGSVSLAALDMCEFNGDETVVVVGSGGNISFERFISLVT
mgnify:CR=1 FL=1